MKYLTGILAFQVPCELDSLGLWNMSKKSFTDESLWDMRESDESRFKDWGIEKDKIIPGRDYTLWNVANHVRAYVDMLEGKQFDKLKGLFLEAIFEPKCRQDIFMLTYGKLRHLADWSEYNRFMKDEFGNAWMSYIDSIHSVAAHIEDSVDAMNKWEAGAGAST